MLPVALYSLFLLFTSCSFVFAATDPSSDPYSCSPSKPCKIGCCSKTGVCGLGPTYCAAVNCTSSCNAKSDCDPGWGSQWSAKEKCPLNVCCSKYGFCGTTSDFCGSATVKSPSCGGSTATNRIVGYYEGWSTTRACDGMYPENIPVSSYTHLNYAFAFIDPSSYAVAPMSDLDVSLYPRFTGLKQIYPGLQTWISIGGWSMNDPDQPTHSTFSNLAASTSAQTAFFSSLIKFLTTYGFDGVDIDWEYPVAPERSGKPADYANYVSFLKNLRAALSASGRTFGVTITLPSSYWYMQNFDIVSMAPLVDWFNVMTYDLHGTWDSTDPYIGPYIYAHTNLTEIDQTMDLLWRNNIDPGKVVMGLGFYGRSFTLSNPGCTTAGCSFSAGGTPGACTQSAGTLSFAEIEGVIAGGAKVSLDSAAAVKTVVWNSNQWVSYDDQQTLQLKVNYANKKCLGGIMVWAASTDDAQGTAAHALNNATGRSALSLAQRSTAPQTAAQCVWGECGQPCPDDLQQAQLSAQSGRGNVGLSNGCSGSQKRSYCCPKNNMPTCTWRGTAPLCRDAACNKDEVEVDSSTSGNGHTCWFNHKNLCCTKVESTSNIGQCSWYGSAPYCSALSLIPLTPFYYSSYPCPKDHPDKVAISKQGYGGEQPCWPHGGYKTWCCTDPVPYSNCKWYQRGNSWISWLDPFTLFQLPVLCKGECPAGKTPVASDSTGCLTGTSYLCCDNPLGNSPPAVDDNLCAVPDYLYLESGQSDGDGNSNDYVEVYDFEGDCFISGEPNSGDPSSPYERRSLDFHANMSEYELMEHYEMLEKRGGSRLQRICGNGPGPVRNGKTNNFRTQPYPKVTGLVSAGRQFISQAKPIGCALAGLAIGPRQAGRYVVEHVMELQSVKSFVQSMIDGVLPGGAKLAQGSLSYTGFFDAGGLFQQTWTQLGAKAPAVGSTPMDTIYSALGTASNIANLQIFDAKLNGLKAILWAGSENLIGTANYNTMSHLERLKALNNIVNVFDYLNRADVQTSLSSAYSGMNSGWANFATAVAKQTTYDFVGAYKAWNTAQCSNMVNVATDFLKDKISSELPYWQSAQAAIDMGSRAAALAELQNLQALQAAIAARVVIGTSWIK